MRDRIGAVLIAAITLSMAVLVAAPTPAAAAAPKVAIIVGPVGSLTANYRTWANEVATAAIAAGATVTKAYSPSATWANVKTAVNGANVIVYFGHGNGFPNPYGSNELTDRTNGWGLNTRTTNGDADSWSDGSLVYCGERALLGTLTSSDDAARRTYCGGTANDGIAPAPGFTMVYAQAHYAPGFGERYTQSTPVTTLTEAQQRVRHYSTPILRLGGSYIATAYGDADEIVSRVLTEPSSSYRTIFKAGRGYSGSTLTDAAHADFAGSRVWVQRTTISGYHFGQPDYWYAFAGDPDRTPGGGSVPSNGPAMVRLAGNDRYATAAAISASTFAPGVSVAYVATGATFPDALAAGAAAASHDGPVLLVAANAVPSATASELARLQPATIKLVGGTAIVSNGVAETLRGYATTGTVQRIAGDNRYATASRVSADTFAPGVPIAYVATGETFPDALSGVAAAGMNGGPILLVRADAIPSETAAELGRLRPGRIIVLGAAGVVSNAVASGLAPYATSGNVTRLAGADRYATSVAISSGTFVTGLTVFIATGVNFPDALGGGPVAGALPGPLLLVPGTSVPSSVAAELRRLNPDTVIILGGTGVVSDGLANQIASLLAD
ncbi:MAG TPA: cell wall-binding repeat-containing protein [Candidatus Limnocylindrales bacterium]|nr:cell wall-binding repeat-containing protein [Candidatus Limnocylindrales bacterium]